MNVPALLVMQINSTVLNQIRMPETPELLSSLAPCIRYHNNRVTYIIYEQGNTRIVNKSLGQIVSYSKDALTKKITVAVKLQDVSLFSQRKPVIKVNGTNKYNY